MTVEREGAEDEGVEDDGPSSDEPGGPFDPNKIRTRLWLPTIDLVLRRIWSHEIDLWPDFHNQAFVWGEPLQSRLIESILIRLPLPSFYMLATDEDVLTVIDGTQRLHAMKRFVDGDLRLTGLEFLVDLEGKTFSDLPRGLQRRLEETALTVHVIEKGTPAEARLHLFKRINMTGASLTAQEIRHAMNPGPVQGFLKSLAESEEFQRATDHRIRPDHMQDRELALRFIAFLLTPPEEYSASDFDTFLSHAMHAINRMTPAERSEHDHRFRRAMNAAAEVLGEYAFRNPTATGQKARISKVAFDAWSVNLDRCSDEEISRLAERRDSLLRGFIKLLATDEAFEKALLRGSNHQGKIRLRFMAIHDLIHKVLNDKVG